PPGDVGGDADHRVQVRPRDRHDHQHGKGHRQPVGGDDAERSERVGEPGAREEDIGDDCPRRDEHDDERADELSQIATKSLHWGLNLGAAGPPVKHPGRQRRGEKGGVKLSAHGRSRDAGPRLCSSVRLLEITNDFPPTLGGIENYIYSIVVRWDPADVVVVTRGTSGCEGVDRTLDAEVRRERVATLLPTPGFQSRVVGLLADMPFDMVHFASATLPLSLLGPRIRRATGIPYAVSVHGGEFMVGARLFRPLMQRALGEAAVALPVSTFTQEAVLRFLRDPPPTEVVSPGVDPARFAPQQRVGPGFPLPTRAPGSSDPGRGPVILCVCRLVARKGPSTLIAALPRI